MDPHSFIARAEAQRWLGIAEKLLMGHDLVGSKTFAIRARDSDPRLEAAEQILAIADTLLAAEKRVVGNNGAQQPDYYAILQLVRFVQDTDQIASQFRRLAVMLNPHQNRFPYSDQAFQLVNDAWAVLSNPMRKSMYDSELDFPPQQQMHTIGFNIEQQHHQQQHHHQQQQQHNFFSINHMGSSHEQELPEPQQTFQTRVQQSHQQQQLQQHNFLSQPSPVRQEQLFQHREQEHLFQPQAQPFQVSSPPHQQTRQPSQPPPPQVQPFQVTSPPHHQARQPLQPPKREQEQLFHQEQLFQPQAQPFQVSSPPQQQSRQPPQPPPQQVQPFQVTSPPHQQTRQPQQPQQPSPAHVQPFQITSPPHHQSRQPQQPPQPQVQPFQVTSPHQQTRQPPQPPQPQPQQRMQSPSPPPPAAVSQPPFSWTQAPPQQQQQPPPPSKPQPQPTPPQLRPQPKPTPPPPQSLPQAQPQPQTQPPPQPQQPSPQSRSQAPPEPQLQQQHQQQPQQHLQPQPPPQQQQLQKQEQPQPQTQTQSQPLHQQQPQPQPQVQEQGSPEHNAATVDLPTQVNSDNGVMEEEIEIEAGEEEAEEIVDDSPTFWTSCPFCFYMYEYPRVYAECTLRCDHCQRAFQAVRIPSPPPIAEGQDAYFCCWGYFPLGVSMSHLDKNNTQGNKKAWTPFSPMFNASGNNIQNQNQNHLNGNAAPKENTFVSKSSGPRIHRNDDISDDVFMEVSEPSADDDDDDDDDSDGEWGSTRRKKMRKKPKRNLKNRAEVLATGAKKGTVKNLGNGSMQVQESGKKDNPVPRRQSGRVGKELGRLDLNVEFNNHEGHGHGQGEDDNNNSNVEGNGFFEGLDEFLSSLPILSVVNEEKVEAA